MEPPTETEPTTMTTTTQTTDTTDPIATLAAKVATATRGWTGMDWDDDEGISAVASRLARGKSVDVDGGISSWIPNDGEHQMHRKALRRLARDIEDGTGEDVTARAQALADEERAYVEERASEAADEGRLAVEAARAGDWDAAADRLRRAERIERAFGDAPSWGGLADFAEAQAQAE